MQDLWEVEPENETIFSYRFRKHAEASNYSVNTHLSPTPNVSRQTFWKQQTFTHYANACLSSIVNVIHPFSRFKLLWDQIIVLLVIFNSIAIPWTLAFKLNKGCEDQVETQNDSCITTSERMVGVAVDAVFWIDMLLSLRTGFIDKKMVIRLNDKEVFQRYLSRYLWIDLIANFPYYTIAASMAEEGGFDDRIAMNLYILPKLLRTARAFRSPGATNFSPTLSRIAKMVGSFLLASHWCGCIWYFIGRWEAEIFGGNAYTGDVSWIEVSLDDEHLTYLSADLRTKYTAAVYWAITTMSTVGYGDIVPQTNIERVFTMVVQFLGTTSAALILGHVAVLIANFNSSSQQFRDKRYHLDAYLKTRQLPAELCKRARTSLVCSWNLHRGLDHKKLLEELPPNMKADILELMLTTEIEDSYLFEHCDRLCIRALVSRLHPETYAPGDIVFCEGDAASCLYFIRSGKAKVIAGDGVIVDVLSEGDIFGETELFDVSQRSATIQALTAVDLQLLSKEDLLKVLSDFPEYRESVESLCLKRKLAVQERMRARINKSEKEKKESNLTEFHKRGEYFDISQKDRTTSAEEGIGRKNENALLDTARCIRQVSDPIMMIRRKESNRFEEKRNHSNFLHELLHLKRNLIEIEELQDRLESIS